MMFIKTRCWQYSCSAANKTDQPKHISSIFSQYKNAISTLSQVLWGGKEWLAYSFLKAERHYVWKHTNAEMGIFLLEKELNQEYLQFGDEINRCLLIYQAKMRWERDCLPRNTSSSTFIPHI